MYVQLKCAEILMNVGAPFDVQRRALHCIMLLDMVGKYVVLKHCCYVT
jgi:hypothetical protein